MTIPTYHDPSRLPKWAQREMELLRLRLKEAKASLAEHHVTGGKTQVSYGTYGEETHYIPQPYPGREQDVTFSFGGTDRMYDKIEVGIRKDHRGEDYLHVMGGHGVMIEMEASNCFRVRLHDA